MYNLALGYYALHNNTTGSNNSVLGYSALYNNTTGTGNSALGYSALFNNTSGAYNSAIGYYALHNNTTGSNNSALGYDALYFSTTGTGNAALGYYALYYNTTGNSNAALGYGSGQNLHGTSSTNILIGYNNEGKYYENNILRIDNQWDTVSTFIVGDMAADTLRINADVKLGKGNLNVGAKSGALLINSAQTSVGGSTSGTAVFSQPEQGSSYKVVIIKCTALLGTASYTFPVAFGTNPSTVATNDVATGVVTSISTTAVTITGATTTGSLMLIGY
jgi:hypothetical protein